MNRSGTMLVILLFALVSTGIAHSATDPLMTIFDTCMAQPVKLCEDRIAGKGPARDAFLLTVKLVKQQKKTMAMYADRLGTEEVNRFNKLFTFKPVMPDLSHYSVRQSRKNEREYRDKGGNKITLLKVAGKWKIALDRGHWKTLPPATNVTGMRLLLGFYHDLQERLIQGQSRKEIENETLLAFAGIYFDDIPPERPEKERFRKFIAQNATTPEAIRKRLLDIADAL